MKYAVVRNNTVDNIIECNGLTVQGLAKVMNCMLIACENYAVAVGDTYDTGVFYRDGEPLERIPSTDEKVAQLQAENAQLTAILNVMLGEEVSV